MSDTVKYIMAMSCALPAMIGWWRFSKTTANYRPLVYRLLLAMLIETALFIDIQVNGVAAFAFVFINIYMLADFALFLYFTGRNHYISKRLQQYLFAAACLVAAGNCWQLQSVFTVFFYLLCFVSAAMLFISIDILTRQMMAVKTSLNRNFWFWVSGLSVVQNAYNLLIFGLYIFSMFGTANGKAIAYIQHFVNAGCYLLMIVPVLLIPVRTSIFRNQPA